MKKVHLVSFGDKRLWITKLIFLYQAHRFKVFDTIKIYNESTLPVLFKRKFSKVLNSNTKGFGFWLWKPETILDRLSKIKDGEILLYLDLGSVINHKGKKTFLDYLQKLNTSKNDIIGVRTVTDHTIESFYNSEDTFTLFKIPPNSKIRFSGQYEAGFILIKKSKLSFEIVKRWRDLTQKNLEILKGENFIKKNHQGFIDHRYDQSFLSLLFKTENINTIPGFYFYKNPTLPLKEKEKEHLLENFIHISDEEKPFLFLRRKILNPSYYVKKIIKQICLKLL